MNKNKNKKTFYIVGGVFFLLAVIYIAAIDWATERFGITIKELLYTVLSPLKGADTGFLTEAVLYVLPPVLTFLALWAVYVLVDQKLRRKLSAALIIKGRKRHVSLNLFQLFRKCLILVAVGAVLCTSIKANNTFQVTEFVSSYIHKTTLYEECYVNPSEASITAPEKARNLIYIYLESMETTYASQADGGYQSDTNYIPNLTRMAAENISFSNSQKLGGFYSVSGTGWTMGSLFATTTGVPFSFPVNGNSMNTRENFASGITALGDVLEQNGYRQMFLCGSDGDFAGRKSYFMQHGNYEIFDLFSAREEGYIPEDYYVWWGYEDLYLYEIAKDQLTELAKDDSQPFNFTMLTVDTHHVDGYVCENCSSEYDTQLANVLTCADSQVYEFIEWCKQQSFYEDTVIIVTGDHPRMDTTLVSGASARTIYNCFLNTDKDIGALNLTDRIFTAMDIFPTVLSALNFEIDGNRLGLGTDLFSGE